VAYIRRFQEDYQARCHHLLDNYRSTAHIIAAANQLIARNRDRMKTRHAIRIDDGRRQDPPGGTWQTKDPVGQGRVQILRLADVSREASAIVDRLQRLKRLDADLAWSSCAVLARTRQTLHAVRAACERRGVPVVRALHRDRCPALHRVREVAVLLDQLESRRDEDAKASGLLRDCRLEEAGGNPWQGFLARLLSDWQAETADRRVPVAHAIQFLYEALAEQRRDAMLGDGVFLSTVHAAKGTEFDHVIIPAGGWSTPCDAATWEEERRLYYVAMTRARKTLCLLAGDRLPHPHAEALRGDFLAHEEWAEPQADRDGSGPVAAYSYELLSLDEYDLGFAGARDSQHPIHRTLARLQPGQRLAVRFFRDRGYLVDDANRRVAKLSQRGVQRWRERQAEIIEARVVALLQRRREDEHPEFARRCRCERWELPWAELVCRGPTISAGG
jgi:ATP-dependent DNA helicase RecQ